MIDLRKQTCDLRKIEGRKHKGSIESFRLYRKDLNKIFLRNISFLANSRELEVNKVKRKDL